MKEVSDELLRKKEIGIYGKLEIETASRGTPALIKGNTIYIDVKAKNIQSLS